MDTDEFNTAKAYLLQADQDGYSVYDHVYNMVTAAADRNAHHVLKSGALLPGFSRNVKGHRFKAEPAVQRRKKTLPDPRDVRQAEAEKALLVPLEDAVVTEVTRPTPYTTVTTTTVQPCAPPATRPLMDDQKYHRMCGIGMPAREYNLLDASISRLARDKKLEDVSLFGRVFGTKANYTVVISRRWKEHGEDTKFWKETYNMAKPVRKGLPLLVQAEPPGVGLNRVTFWICGHVGGDWMPLPDVTPQQVAAARKIKKMFTGDPEEEVVSYPPFPGKEKDYLRAQLARIWCGTTVCPEGEVEVFEPEEEEEEEADEDDDKPKPPKPLKVHPLVTDPKPVSLEESNGVSAPYAARDKWVHSAPYLYKTGRATLLPPAPEPAEGEEEAPEDEEGEEKEPLEEEKKELLQPVAEDVRYAAIRVPKEPAEGEEEEEDKEDVDNDDKEPEEEEGGDDEDNPNLVVLHSWNARSANNFYKKHGIVMLRSLRWPGAFSWMAPNKISGTVYFGDGLKATDAAYNPVLPPPVQQEVADLVEMPDPTSMTEKMILRGEEPKEADSEDEKEEEEEEPAE